MSLEHELVELNGAYQSIVATNLDLRERIQQLEQLARDYYKLLWDRPMIVYGDMAGLNDWQQRRDTLQQRAKELLASEQ